MSLRFSISGFSLDTMQSFFGSKNRELIETIKIEFKESMEDFPLEHEESINDMTKEGHELIEQVINDGLSLSHVEVENEAHVFLADFLAQYEQEHEYATEADWKTFVLSDFSGTYGKVLGENANKLFNYLEIGRPLFGKRIGTGWAYYAYLISDEISLLQDGLENVQGAILSRNQGDELAEFVECMQGWLDEIVYSEQDLWFYAD